MSVNDLEVSLELREYLRLHDEVGRPEPRQALLTHVQRLGRRRSRVAVLCGLAASGRRGRGCLWQGCRQGSF